MQIVLTPEDLKRLRPSTREALLEELGISRPAGAPGRKGGGKSQATPEQAPADAVEVLVGSINDRARTALSLLVSAGGKLEWTAIAAKVPKLQPGRFLAAVHRRYRTLTGDAASVLISLDERGETPVLRIDRRMLPRLREALG